MSDVHLCGICRRKVPSKGVFRVEYLYEAGDVGSPVYFHIGCYDLMVRHMKDMWKEVDDLRRAYSER